MYWYADRGGLAILKLDSGKEGRESPFEHGGPSVGHGRPWEVCIPSINRGGKQLQRIQIAEEICQHPFNSDSDETSMIKLDEAYHQLESSMDRIPSVQTLIQAGGLKMTWSSLTKSMVMSDLTTPRSRANLDQGQASIG